MKQRYVFSYNGIVHFIRGLIPLDTFAQPVAPHMHPSQTYIWRNKVTDGYKIGENYKEEPMDLSNYLLLRTKEMLLL